jgi:hypothetical protein
MTKDGRTKHAALASSETFRPYRRYRLPYANETQKGEKSMEPADESVRGVVEDKSCNDVKLWERPRTQ